MSASLSLPCPSVPFFSRLCICIGVQYLFFSCWLTSLCMTDSARVVFGNIRICCWCFGVGRCHIQKKNQDFWFLLKSWRIWQPWLQHPMGLLSGLSFYLRWGPPGGRSCHPVALLSSWHGSRGSVPLIIVLVPLLKEESKRFLVPMFSIKSGGKTCAKSLGWEWVLCICGWEKRLREEGRSG